MAASIELGCMGMSECQIFAPALIVIESFRPLIFIGQSNLQSSGVGTPPEGDLFGHNFIKSYLRVGESRQKIISSVKLAYAKLRYPIAYFQPAIVVEHTSNVRDPGGEHLDFKIAGSDGEEVGSYDEEWLSADLHLQKELVDGFKLRAGDFKITAESVVDHHKFHNFKYTV